MAVALTDGDADECLEVTVHGVKHYLHSTTARALSDMLLERIDEWNGVAESTGLVECEPRSVAVPERDCYPARA